MRFAYFGLAFVLLAAVPAQARHAGKTARSKEAVAEQKEGPMDAEQLRDLLVTTGLPKDDEIRKSFYRAHTTPYNLPELYLEVLVPNDWEAHPVGVTRSEMAQDRERPIPLLEMAPKKAQDVKLQAFYVRVPKEVPLEKVLLSYAKSAGFQLLGRQHGDYNQRYVEEALLRMDSKDFGPHVTRLAASRRGDLVFMIACSARAAEFPRWKRVFATAVVTFDPSGKPPR